MTYASMNSMRGEVHSYRDDLESLAYVLLYAKLGRLPWQKHRKVKNMGNFKVTLLIIKHINF